VNSYKLIPGLQLRPLSPEDAHALSYIELEIFPAPWSEESLKTFLALHNVEGEAAMLDGQIIGYVFVQYAADEVHILNLGVRPNYRRRGLATLLLLRLLERARKQRASACFLEVRVGNPAAQKLYFKQKFAPVTVRKQYYPDGEDALILAKQL
jgi:ribosomal-protein-alanine N-acetyltransferase